jgi:hypothetical protein
MIFRCRMYRVAPGKLEAFNTFFLTRLLPVQRRYGAKLVGRWQSDDGNVLLALWVYESLDAYEAIQGRVSSDPDSAEAQTYRREHLNPLYTETEEWMMTSAVPLELTALSALAKGG